MKLSWIKCLPIFFREKIENHHGLQSIIKNIIWLLIDKLLRIVVGLFVGVWTARYLGPEQFGQLSYAAAFVSLFSGIAVLGLDSVVVREFINNPDKKAELLGSTLVLKLVGSTSAYAIAMVVIFFLRPMDKMAWVLVSIIGAGMLFQSFDAFDLLFQSRLKSKYTVYAKNLAFLLAASMKVTFIMSGASLIYFAVSSLAEFAIGAIGLFFVYRFTENNFGKLYISWPIMCSLIKSSWPLLLSGTLVVITLNVDRIILGQIMGDYEVGLYGVVNQLSTIWYMVPMLVGVSIAPALTREYGLNLKFYNKKLQIIYKAMTITSILGGCVVYFISDSVVQVLFGAQYVGAGDILAVHIFGSVFIFHVSIRTRALIIENKQIFITKIAVLTLVVNVVVNIFLIKKIGVLGAAYASLLSWLMCAAIFPLLWPETRSSALMLWKSFNPLMKFRLK